MAKAARGGTRRRGSRGRGGWRCPCPDSRRGSSRFKLWRSGSLRKFLTTNSPICCRIGRAATPSLPIISSTSPILFSEHEVQCLLLEEGVYDRAVPPPEMNTKAKILAYGQDVLGRFQIWWDGPPACAPTCDGTSYTGHRETDHRPWKSLRVCRCPTRFDDERFITWNLNQPAGSNFLTAHQTVSGRFCGHAFWVGTLFHQAPSPDMLLFSTNCIEAV